MMHTLILVQEPIAKMISKLLYPLRYGKSWFFSF